MLFPSFNSSTIYANVAPPDWQPGVIDSVLLLGGFRQFRGQESLAQHPASASSPIKCINYLDHGSSSTPRLAARSPWLSAPYGWVASRREAWSHRLSALPRLVPSLNAQLFKLLHSLILAVVLLIMLKLCFTLLLYIVYLV